MTANRTPWAGGQTPALHSSPRGAPARGWSFRAILDLFRASGSRWIDDRCDRLAAALSYYALFSLFPLALLAVTALGFFLGEQPGTREQIVNSMNVTDSPALKSLLDDTLASMQQHQTARGIGTVVGIATLLFGASGVFSELQAAFNLVWRVPDPPSKGIWNTILTTVKSKSIAFLLVLFAGFALLASLVVSTALSALQKSTGGALGGSWLWVPLDLVVSTAIMAGVLASLYRVLPRTSVAWRDVLLGALITSLAFTALKKLLAYYLAHLGSYAAYGVVGALLGMLTWIYVTSMLLYFGVELTRVYAEQHGSLAKAP